jgi:hypothetical protein
MKCPNQKCTFLLTDIELIKFMPSKDYELLNEDKFKYNLISGLKPNEIIIDCLTPNCN